MAGKRKINHRFSYLDDFSLSESGKYEYTGKTYIFACESRSYKRALAELWLFSGSALISSVAAGCIPSQCIIDCVYVIIPYVCHLIFTVMLCWSAARLTFAKKPLRDYDYKAINEAIPSRAGLSAITSVFVLLMIILYFIFDSSGGISHYTVVFVITESVSALFSIISYRCGKHFLWKEKEKKI